MNASLDLFDRFGPILWRASWQAAVLALVVVVVLAVAGRRLAPRWRFLCWSLVLLRLLIPIVPPAQFSLFNLWDVRDDALVPPTAPGFDLASAPDETGTFHLEYRVGEALSAASHDARRDPAPQDVANEPRSSAALLASSPESPPAAPIRWTVWKFVGLAWMAGFVSVSCFVGCQLARLRRRSRSWHDVADPRIHEELNRCRKLVQVRRNVRLLVTPGDCGPAVTGVFRPAILLPERLLSDLPVEELRMILLHELAHLRRGDVATQWLVVFARTIHWCNPVAWLAATWLQVERELACDEAVLAALEPRTRLQYGELLVRLAQGATMAFPAPGLLGTIENRKSLTRRLEMIRDFRPRSRIASTLAICLLGVTILVGFTDAKSAPVSRNEEASPDSSASSQNDPPMVLIDEAERDRRVAQKDVKPGPTEAVVREGWQTTVALPDHKMGELNLGPSRLKAWTENGWMIVRRSLADDELDWQVVLARASDPKPPEIKVNSGDGSLDLKYREYFIRESSPFGGRLRVYRERKSEQSPTWPLVEIKDRNQGRPGGSMGLAFEFFGSNYWCWLQSGTVQNRPDIWLRVRPTTERPMDPTRAAGAPQVAMALGGPFEMNLGESHVNDEGDLLVASRGTIEMAANGLSDRRLVDWLTKRELTTDAPPITAGRWLNVEGKALLQQGQLRGKVVLLQFLSTGSPLSLKGLGRLEGLHKKYAGRGLEIIGIHAADKASEGETAKEFLKSAGVTFPVMVDKANEEQGGSFAQGETAKRYAVDVLPSCFLIDKRGKIFVGFGMTPPADATIEGLLLRDEVAPPLDAKEWVGSDKPLALEQLKGKVVLLMFGTARRSPLWQWAGLEAHYKKYGDQGLVVIGVYRPGDNEAVAKTLPAAGVKLPVAIDTGDIAKRYAVGNLTAYFLIDRTGRILYGTGPQNSYPVPPPSDAMIEEALK